VTKHDPPLSTVINSRSWPSSPAVRGNRLRFVRPSSRSGLNLLRGEQHRLDIPGYSSPISVGARRGLWSTTQRATPGERQPTEAHVYTGSRHHVSTPSRPPRSIAGRATRPTATRPAAPAVTSASTPRICLAVSPSRHRQSASRDHRRLTGSGSAARLLCVDRIRITSAARARRACR